MEEHTWYELRGVCLIGPDESIGKWIPFARFASRHSAEDHAKTLLYDVQLWFGDRMLGTFLNVESYKAAMRDRIVKFVPADQKI